MRYFIQLAYNGTRFHGWQVQPNAITVQEVLTKAISIITREQVEVVGAGRTDTGVHASFYVAHFELQKELADEAKMCFKLNSFLNDDIRIDRIFKVDSEMHARFSAESRTYHYYLSEKKEPFRQEVIAFTPYKLDVDAMNKAAICIMDYIDFTSFSKLHTDVKTNNCKVMKAEWQRVDGVLVFEITADRFLRNMVRAIVGTLLEVGRGKLSVSGFCEIIEAKDRGLAGASAVPGGLFLSNISYPNGVDCQFVKSE